jgi:tetratricopeptide (TPR) repeat protein
VGEPDLDAVVADLEAGRIDQGTARKLAKRVVPNKDTGAQVARLTFEAAQGYEAGRLHEARAKATIVAATVENWGKLRTRFGFVRGRITEGVFDIQARALELLSLIESDAGHEDAALRLRSQSELAMAGLGNAASAQLAITDMRAARALRLGHPTDAVTTWEHLLQIAQLDETQRAAAQVGLATSLRAAGWPADGIAALQASAASFERAGRGPAVLEADLERGIQMLQTADRAQGLAVIAEVAEGAAATGHHEVEADARLRLGVIASEADDHTEANRQFRLAADVARRFGDQAKVIVALRNAADSLRLSGDLDSAERLLDEALNIDRTPSVEIDQAKARIMLALLRDRQGRKDDAARLLDEAAATFRHRLDSLERGELPRLREHLQKQLRQVDSLRDQMGLEPGAPLAH